MRFLARLGWNIADSAPGCLAGFLGGVIASSRHWSFAPGAVLCLMCGVAAGLAARLERTARRHLHKEN